MSTRRWRQGKHVAQNVYDGDRPVCQCQTVNDARLIVESVNLVFLFREYEILTSVADPDAPELEKKAEPR